MPEGDTAWLTAHRLHQALASRPLNRAEFRVPQLATVDLTGLVVDEVLARGKHLLIRLDGRLTVHSHLRMDGSWFLTPAGTTARRGPDHAVRVLLENFDWRATGFRIHDLAVLSRDREPEVVGHLGPDLLGPDWDHAEALRRLTAEPARPIGEALLDQRNLAGVGNMYKCEVLFLTGTNPWTPVAGVTLDPIITTAHRLLRANRDHPEQSTTGSLRRGEQHWVYRRDRQPCRRCRTPISYAEQGAPPYSRATYWCPSCQPGER